MKYLILPSRIVISICIWGAFYLLNENYINFDKGILNFIYYFFVTVIVVWVNMKMRKMINENKG